MLNAAANLVKPGGILVYAVCSCEPEENEQVITAFLQKRKDYSQLTMEDISQFSNTSFKTKDHCFKTYPHALHMDGFFIARLKRAHKPQ